MKLKCPDCGKQYESGKFCLECGAKLQEVAPELVCPSCGFKAKTGKFCPECGTKLTEQCATPIAEVNNVPEERKFNEKDERFAKYYDKKGFPRTIPQEERSIAIEELTLFAEQGIAEAKMLLGNILFLNKKPEKGIKLLKEAEESGDTLAYFLMSIGYLYGIEPIVVQNHDEAEKRLLKFYQEFDDGSTAGMLAKLYTFSVVKCDYQKAFEYATIAAEDDEELGYEVLGALYLNGWGIEKNIQLALDNYKMAASFGNEGAMNQIGFIFMGSEDFEANPEQSFYWFNEAAKKGDDFGLFNLGYCYQQGFGVEMDAEKAAEYFKKAAELGHIDAMYQLGSYYQNILIDTNKAKMWYQKAAELGHAESLNSLGDIYSDMGDFKEAVKYFRKAVEQDEPSAYSNLATCYRDGKGVGQDLKKAAELLKKASKLGVEDANQMLLDLNIPVKQSKENKNTAKKTEKNTTKDGNDNQVSANEWYVPEGTTVLDNTILPDQSDKWRETIKVVFLPRTITSIDLILEDDGCVGDLYIFPNLEKVVIPTGEMDRFSEMSFYIDNEWCKVWYDNGSHICPEILPFISTWFEATPYNITVLSKNSYLMDTVIISPKCREIAKNAIEKQKSIKRIIMSDSVHVVGKEAFYECKNLTEITLSKNIRVIPKYMLQNCVNLTEIVIPEGVSIIEEGAFNGCFALHTITLPSTISRIDNGGTFGLNAFGMCNALEKIIVPKGMRNHFAELLGKRAKYIVEA